MKRKVAKKVLDNFSDIREIIIKFYSPIPTVQQMSNITGELLKRHFPKGKCHERGQALMLHAEMLIAIHQLLSDFHKEG